MVGINKKKQLLVLLSVVPKLLWLLGGTWWLPASSSLELPFGLRRLRRHPRPPRRHHVPPINHRVWNNVIPSSSTEDESKHVVQDKNGFDPHHKNNIIANTIQDEVNNNINNSNKAAVDEDIEFLFSYDSSNKGDNDEDDDDDDDEEEDHHQDDDADAVTVLQAECEPPPPNAMERAWRHCKKPLLRVGSKGVQFSHGNSLRQLLEAHQIVKVKVNTKRFGSLENAFDVLKSLAVESGAPEGIELVQARDGEKTIMFGMPGILERIERDEFPPLERHRDQYHNNKNNNNHVTSQPQP